jgi:hypothetical protein
MTVITGIGLMIFKLLSLSIIFVINIFHSAPLYAGNNEKCKCSQFNFSPGSVSTGTGSEERKIEIPGKLLAFSCSEKRLYYLVGDYREEENSGSPVESSYHLGFFNPGNEEKEREFATKIKLLLGQGESVKIFAEGENVYILNGAGILYHVNLNSMSVSQREGVSDATLAGMTLVLVEEESGKLNINGKYLPLTITGKSRIGGVTDNRLVSLTNGNETEVIDVETVESVYQYSSKGSYAVSDEYNLVISAQEEILDSSRAGIQPMVFYKVSIDGIESGRTETGVSGSEKSLRTLVPPGGYHVIQLERWELSLKKKRYRRANNLYQPKKIRIYIPQKRVIKLEVNYNGKEYSFSKQAVKR